MCVCIYIICIYKYVYIYILTCNGGARGHAPSQAAPSSVWQALRSLQGPLRQGWRSVSISTFVPVKQLTCVPISSSTASCLAAMRALSRRGCVTQCRKSRAPKAVLVCFSSQKSEPSCVWSFWFARTCIRQHTSAYVSIRQHTSAYVSIRQHTSA